MTQRQRQLLDFIGAQIAETGVCPSYTEMREALGLASKSGINRLIMSLEERGHIRRLKGRFRAIEIAQPEQQQRAVIVCPHCGGRIGAHLAEAA